MKLIISYIAFVIILISIFSDFIEGEVNLRGTVLSLDSERWGFLAFVAFKLFAALGFVIYYKFIDQPEDN